MRRSILPIPTAQLPDQAGDPSIGGADLHAVFALAGRHKGFSRMRRLTSERQAGRERCLPAGEDTTNTPQGGGLACDADAEPTGQHLSDFSDASRSSRDRAAQSALRVLARRPVRLRKSRTWPVAPPGVLVIIVTRCCGSPAATFQPYAALGAQVVPVGGGPAWSPALLDVTNNND
ncbi:hypothetical protein VTN02DRAFT_4074 [Thermoascus thermophilus]